jgi:hypothetical protein
MFPFLIIAYSTTNGLAPSEAAGPAPMAPNRWTWKKWINPASLIAAPQLRNRNLENRDFIIQVFQALNSRRLASSDENPRPELKFSQRSLSSVSFDVSCRDTKDARDGKRQHEFQVRAD